MQLDSIVESVAAQRLSGVTAAMLHALLLTLIALFVTLFVFLAWNLGYWRRRGVWEPYALPLLGSFPNMVWPRRHFLNDMRDLYM